MTKLCPRGKAAAKRKFKVYPSAYANAYASKICAGKIKDPSGVKRKDFRGPKPAGKAMGGRILQERIEKGAKERLVIAEIPMTILNNLSIEAPKSSTVLISFCKLESRFFQDVLFISASFILQIRGSKMVIAIGKMNIITIKTYGVFRINPSNS